MLKVILVACALVHVIVGAPYLQNFETECKLHRHKDSTTMHPKSPDQSRLLLTTQIMVCRDIRTNRTICSEDKTA